MPHTRSQQGDDTLVEGAGQDAENRSNVLDTGVVASQDLVPPVAAAIISHIDTLFGAVHRRFTAVEASQAETNIHAQGGSFLPSLPASSPLTVDVPQRFRDDGTVHPVDFLDTVSRVVGSRAASIDYAISLMDGMPHDWGKAFRYLWQEWAAFEASFLDMFWSEEVQERIIAELHHKQYIRADHGSMVSFFVSWMKKVQHLSPPLAPKTFLRRMSHLFPAHVENVLVAARVSTAPEMLAILKDLDVALEHRHGRSKVDAVRSHAGPSTSGAAPFQQGRDGTSRPLQWRERRHVNVQQVATRQESAAERSEQSSSDTAVTNDGRGISGAEN